MGCVKELLKRKPGGTVFGNILRVVGDRLTGGLYSAIIPAPPIVGNTGGLTGGYDEAPQTNNGLSQPRRPFINIDNLNPFGDRPIDTTFGFPPFVPTENVGTSGNSFTDFVDNIFPIGINPANPNDVDVIPTTDSNPYGLPAHVLQIVESIVNHLDDGGDIEEIPSSFVDILDSYFEGTPAAGLLESIGIDFNTGDVNNPELLHQTTGVVIPTDWDVNGNIGGVDFNIGKDNPEEKPEDDSSWYDKTIDWIKENVALTVGIVSVPVLAIGYYLYKRFRPY